MDTDCPREEDRPSELFPRQLATHSPTHWITQDALIDTDMHARAGDAELIPWLLVLDCAQHVAKELRSIMRDTRSHIKLCYVQRNFTGYTQPLDRAYMRAFKSSICQEVAKHFAEFFLEAGSNFERVDLDSSTSVLRQILISFVHTAAQIADSPQYRAAGWRFIDWNEVEQRELLAEARRLLETGELFPRGTAEEPHTPDAEAKAGDSEPEAHVMQPLADDHSSDDEDTPTGVEESAAPAEQAAPADAAAPERASMSLLERQVHNPGPGARVSAQRRQRARSYPCQSRRCRHLLVQKEFSFVVASLSVHSA